MTWRILRIATTLIIIQSLLFFPTPVSRAQDGPTKAEIILAQEASDLFLKRLSDKEFLGLPPGTRLLNAPTFMLFWLSMAEVNGKQKIIWAQFIGPIC